jgi:hypothetical protein
MSDTYDSHRSDSNRSFNNTYGSFNQLDDPNNDEVNLLRMKYKQTDNRVYHDFFKTKMCSLNALNICKKGTNCPFAHSEDELREKPNLYKTKLCDAFLQEGKCSKGENCHFAHGEDELRSTPDLFKTAICNLWTQGKCTAGDQCRFAHGYEDLRPAPSHQKFKAGHKKKSHNFTPKSNPNQNYYYNQMSYPANFYSYPMYPVSALPGQIPSPYMMGQPYGYQPEMQNPPHNH